MNPVRSRGSLDCATLSVCFAFVGSLQYLAFKSEAQAPLEAELLTGQASYLPAKARAREATL